MKHNHGVGFLISVFAVVMTVLAILSGAGRMMIIYKQSASQKSVLRGVKSIDNATQAVVEDFSGVLESVSKKKYEEFKAVAEETSDNPIKENEIENYYRLGIINAFRETIGEGDELVSYISNICPKPLSGKLYIDEENAPYIYVEKASDEVILGASVKNVTFIYDGIPGIQRKETVDFSINFPDAIFYAGNEEMFDYSMMAAKGIYISGATSSIVGNIYAGEHSALESRDAEIAYGEIGSYGGLNFLSTQVGIEADRILSAADINLNGSFVIFNPDKTNAIKCFAGKIRKMRSYTSDSIYSISGDFYGNGEIPESAMEEYAEIKNTAELTLSGIAEIPFYYDSNNDKNYSGEYRKIISSEDVEITEDVTGIVFTPGNVIVNAGCNIEGLILCGDRIYLLGNNSIVSNALVVKKIISDEITENNTVDIIDEQEEIIDTDEEIDSGIVYHALDYIGGLVYPGLKEPNYYITPYQE